MSDLEQVLRESRINSVMEFINHNVDRHVDVKELASLNRLSNQTLHLLCAAIDEVVTAAVTTHD